MGLDWRTLDLSSYFETLEAFNEMSDGGEGEKTAPGERLSKFLSAHMGQ